MPYRPPRFRESDKPARRAVSPFSEKPRLVESGPRKQKPLRQGRGLKYLDMRMAWLFSALLHVFTPVGLIIGFFLIMLILGLEFPDLFAKPEPKKPDLEFVLVPPDQLEQPPIDPNTRYRAEKNTRAGGEHNPSKPIIVPEPVKQVTPTEEQAPPVPQVQPSPPVKVIEPPKEIVKEKPTPPKKQVKMVKKPTEVKPVDRPPLPPIARAIPMPALPKSADGPIVKQPAKSASASSSQPTPVMTNAGVTGQQPTYSARSAGSMSAEANPSPGNKSATVGVDAISEPDFGPYMRDLQKKIKQTWHPPRGNESKRIVVVFRVNREGKLEQVKIVKSSGEPLADQAALLAIQQTFPFRPLPAEYTQEDIDIEFTFDYNVFGGKHKTGNRNNS